MEKPNFVRNGGINLPIGFRFRPTDEELVVHYLKRKVFSFPLPASVIPDLDVFQTNPWDLPGDSREKRYFFCKRSKTNVKKCKGITGSGYWKAMGKEKYIVARGSNQAVGVKKSLVFCQGKRPRGLKTDWVMHEYRLAASQTTPNSTQKFVVETEEWVVCRIHQKMRKSKNKIGVKSKTGNVGEIRPSVMDIMKIEDRSSDSGPPQPSPASSSCSSDHITEEEVSSKTSDQEETSAYILV